jgi:PAS domain S-box-containing protein
MSRSELYSIGEVAAILGVSAHTVRAWERRHGIVDPARTASRHRRYTGEEVDLLREVKRAVDLDGISVRLAFETVTGRQRRVDARLRGARKPDTPELRDASDQDMWRAVADALPEVVLVVDPRGKIVQANVATARLFDVVRQHLVGRSFTDLVEPSDRAKAELLFNPRPRVVNGWELNLTTANGVRLYRIEVRAVPQAGETLLAVVGTEMFPAEPAARRAVRSQGAARVAPADAPTAAAVFQELLDGLPFGVAVTTIGPEPRIVYANRRLTETVARPLRELTGRGIDEVLPHTLTEPAFRRAASSGSPTTVRDVSVLSRDAAPARGRRSDVIFQPLLSSARKIASMLLVIEDAAASAAATHEPRHPAPDDHLAMAKTAVQLCIAGLDELRNAVPDAEFMVAIPGRGEERALVTMSSEVAPGRDRRIAAALRQAIRSAGARGAGVDAAVTSGARRFIVSALPLSPLKTLGAVAWVRPVGVSMSSATRTLLNSVVDRLAIAAELLGVRDDAARKTSKLHAITSVAAVVREGAGDARLGVRFLRRLTEIIEADGAAIGRIDGGDFVVEAAYAASGAHARPGDRFPLAGQYVSDSVATGSATHTTTIGTPGLPGPIRRSLSRMKRAISVPLLVDGRVEHVITLLRRSDRPFEEGDVLVAQAVSSVALLALSVGDPDSAEVAKKVQNH